MPDFWKIIKARRSVREFQEKEIPPQFIKKIIQAASIAPSGGNQKNWHFMIVKNKEIKNRLKEVIVKRVAGVCLKMQSERAKREFNSYSEYFTFFSQAPVVIAVVMKPYDSLSARILARYEPETLYGSTAGIQSVAAAIENLLLACAALGLGACWMTGPLIAKKELEGVLKIKTPDELLALVPVGFPKEKIHPNNFPKSLKEFVTEI